MAKKQPRTKELATIPVEIIERKIYLIRGQKVMLDADLAEIYGVPTKSLNLAVRRNKDRFPEDFMFQLTKEEAASLRFQFETSKEGRGGRRYAPHAPYRTWRGYALVGPPQQACGTDEYAHYAGLREAPRGTRDA
jgi:hypothetical protein